MGAMYRETSKFTADSWSKMEGSSFDYKHAVQFSALESVSHDLVADYAKNATEIYQHFRQTSSLFTRGSRPPTDGKLDSWLQQTFTDPAPFNYVIRDLAAVVNASVSLPSDGGQHLADVTSTLAA